MFGYQISGGQNLVLRPTGVCFLVFFKDSDACRFLDVGTNSIIEARDAEFFEDKFIKDKDLALKNISENTEKFIALDESNSPEAEGTDAEEETQEVAEPPSKRIRKQKNFGDDFIIYNTEGDPLTFKEAMQSKNAIP